jgi:hypothetical protein
MKELKPQVVRDDYSQRSATQLAGSAAALVGYRIEISVLLNLATFSGIAPKNSTTQDDVDSHHHSVAFFCA